MKAARFIRQYGVPGVRSYLARAGFPTSRQRIYRWTTGRDMPDRNRAFLIFKLSRGQLRIGDMITGERRTIPVPPPSPRSRRKR